MAVPFDHIASPFDSVFTTSAIGQLQRKRVWNYLVGVFPQLEGMELLELNNGSDEEALIFSDKGCNVVATDLSAQTQHLTRQKESAFSLPQSPYPQYLDFENMTGFNWDKKYDLIFSNFGGLNCVSPDSLQKLFDLLPSMLNRKGRFVAVIMPRFCLMETLYHLAKFEFGKAFQRVTDKEVFVNKDGIPLRTWFYKPSQIITLAKKHFQIVKVNPVGLVLPPTGMRNFFLRKKKVIANLNKVENRLCDTAAYAGLADHFLIDMRLK